MKIQACYITVLQFSFAQGPNLKIPVSTWHATSPSTYQYNIIDSSPKKREACTKKRWNFLNPALDRNDARPRITWQRHLSADKEV